MNRPRPAHVALTLALLALLLAPVRADDEGPAARVAFRDDPEQGRMQVLIDGKEALVYRYGPGVDLPHYYPVRSPSGRSLTVQKTEPFPHHRSFWFADAVVLEGHPRADIYSALNTQVDPRDPRSPFRNFIQHIEFLPPKPSGDDAAEITAKLRWIIEGDVPVIDEVRTQRVVPLGDGEYRLDLTFTLTAPYGPVTFVSDWVHYAWPFVRMSPEFSVDQGGTMTNSEGGINQAGTNGQPARWVDYSNTVEGTTEGLTIFSHPENPYPHKWLTRDYGTFGPRRADDKSGVPFVLKPGDSLTQRVGVLVHRGDVTTGRVAERYRQYAADEP